MELNATVQTKVTAVALNYKSQQGQLESSLFLQRPQYGLRRGERPSPGLAQAHEISGEDTRTAPRHNPSDQHEYKPEGKMPLSGNPTRCETPPWVLPLEPQASAPLRLQCTPQCPHPEAALKAGTSAQTAATGGNRPAHTELPHYLVIDCHFRVGITFVESFHLTEQMRVWQIHHSELNRAGMDQGRKLELSEGSTDSKESNTCSHLNQNL